MNSGNPGGTAIGEPFTITTRTSTSSSAQAMNSFASSFSTRENGPVESCDGELSDGRQPDCQLHASTANEDEESIDSEEDLSSPSLWQRRRLRSSEGNDTRQRARHRLMGRCRVPKGQGRGRSGTRRPNTHTLERGVGHQSVFERCECGPRELPQKIKLSSRSSAESTSTAITTSMR